MQAELSGKRIAKLFSALLAAALVVSSLVFCALAADKGSHGNPGVLPPHANAFGKTYGEWAGEWWNWVYYGPVETHPLWDITGAFGALNQEGPVWFLVGNRGGTTERALTVPTGKALFFPIIVYGARASVHGTTEEALRARANLVMNLVDKDSLAVTVDGVALQDLASYRVESPPGGYTLHVPEGSFLTTQAGYAPGDYLGVTDGYWIMLAPLSAGEHEIQFSAAIPALNYSLHVTYHLSVVGGK